MVFVLVKRFLRVIGLDPEAANERQQKLIRLISLSLILFHVIPSVHGIVWRLLTNKDLSMYTDVLMFFWFVVKALFDFIVIWFRMDRFKLLFAEAAELTKESSKETVLKNKKALRRTILAYVMIMTVNLTATVLMMALTPKEFERLHRYLFDESYSPVFEIVGIISFLGGQLCTFVNLITQVFYYSFCLFFITLYEQLEQQILDINDKKKDSSESIKTAVQEHIRIMNMIKSVSHEFREMLVWDFVVYTIILGLILFNSTTSIESMFKLFYLPSIFFGAYIFCYGSYIVSSKGRAMSRMMYMELNWVDMEKKHQKSLLIMMAQFQKRIKIKLMGIKTVDLELFIFIINTAYSIFNIMIKLNAD